MGEQSMSTVDEAAVQRQREHAELVSAIKCQLVEDEQECAGLPATAAARGRELQRRCELYRRILAEMERV